MKRKAAKFLSLILTAAVIFSGTVFTAFAAETAETKNPALASALADTIILKTEDNFEYAVLSVQDNGDSDWQWAKPEQYNADEHTVSFTGLSPDTEYTFGQRAVDSEDVKDTDRATYKTAPKAENNDPAPEETKAPETVAETQESKAPETVAETQESKAPETEPETQESKAPETEPETQESKAPETEPETQESKAPETKPETQESKAPETKPETQESKAPETEPETQETKAPETEPETQESKAPETEAEPQETEAPETETSETKPPRPSSDNPDSNEADAHGGEKLSGNESEKLPDENDNKTEPDSIKAPTPNAPVLVSVTDSEISVALADGADQTFRYEYSLNGQDFSDSTNFSGLKADTDYEVKVRIKAGNYNNKEYEASDLSESLKVHTKLSAKAAPAVPDIMERTDTSVVFEKADGIEYGLYDGEVITWYNDNSFNGLKAGTEYRFVFRQTYDDAKQMPSINTGELKVSTLKSAAAAPPAPELLSRTETSVSVKAVSGQEYALLTQNGSEAWQSSGEFKNLKPNTQYSIVTRIAYNANEAAESKVSAPLAVKTVIAFSGSSLDGITAGKTYEAGTSFKVTANGSGMDNSAPSLGDTRYRPVRWNWGGKDEGTWKASPYSTSFTLVDAGSYTLNIVYTLETYTANGWESTGTENTLKVPFKISAKEYTIKATATAGGKLSPSGTLTVLQAKNYTIKMIPDKNYKLVKVLVDGKETSVKDLKYTFENISADHTIHAVFEKVSPLDAPKTGDNTPVLPIIIAAGISLAAVIAAAVLLIRRRIKK